MKLGTIQNVNIYDEETWSEGTSIWFEDENHIRNISLKSLIKRDFKIVDVLKKYGYNITDDKAFDKQLELLHHEERYYCEKCKDSFPHKVFVFLGITVCRNCQQVNERFTPENVKVTLPQK